MHKRALIELLQGVSAATVYGLVTMKYLEEPARTTQLIAELPSHFYFEAPDGTKESQPLAQLAEILADTTQRRTLIGNYVIALRTSLVRFTFELIKEYSTRNGQMSTFNASNLILFARTIRNVVSYGEGVFLEKWPHKEFAKKGIEQVSWRHLTLTAEDEGKLVRFDSYDAWRLHLDLYEFARDVLP